MNLKNEAIESSRIKDIGSVTGTSVGSINSDNLIMVSIKDALVVMNEKSKKYKDDPVGQFEKIAQKLESDIRSHIKVFFISLITLA